MATLSPTPYNAAHFDVRFSGADNLAMGFSEVQFSPFVNDALAATENSATAGATSPKRLVLRRGFDGSLALYRWWDLSRKRHLQRGRTVTVHLLDAAHVPVACWRFSQAHPVLLEYSALHALHAGLLMETLTLQYERMTMK